MPSAPGSASRSAAGFDARASRAADTSDAGSHVPLWRFDSVANLALPEGCVLVGVELLEDAVELPSFRHPLNAAYVLGPERSGLSPAMLARCRHVVRIPTRFSLNLAVAGALVLYDRLLQHGRFADRPVAAGGAPPAEAAGRARPAGVPPHRPCLGPERRGAHGGGMSRRRLSGGAGIRISSTMRASFSLLLAAPLPRRPGAGPVEAPGAARAGAPGTDDRGAAGDRQVRRLARPPPTSRPGRRSATPSPARRARRRSSPAAATPCC